MAWWIVLLMHLVAAEPTESEYIYGGPGTVYVYIVYGLHYLFNVVTNKKDIPHAILIRALEPLEGIDYMLKRVGKP